LAAKKCVQIEMKSSACNASQMRQFPEGCGEIFPLVFLFFLFFFLSTSKGILVLGASIKVYYYLNLNKLNTNGEDYNIGIFYNNQVHLIHF